MKITTLVLAFAPLAAMLSACTYTSDRTVVGGPDAEEAAIRLESSKQSYDRCIENSAPGQPSCDSLEALYKKDRAAYENSVK